MKLNIDLGSKGPGECCSSPTKSEPSVYYPSFCYTGDKPMDIPEEGEMVIRYKKVSSTKETRDDKTRYICTIEIREIVSAEEEDDEDEVTPPAKNLSAEAGDALDKLMMEKIKAKKDAAGESY